MAIEQHKDFEKENHRLQDTKDYIEEVIDVSLKSKETSRQYKASNG